MTGRIEGMEKTEKSKIIPDFLIEEGTTVPIYFLLEMFK